MLYSYLLSSLIPICVRFTHFIIFLPPNFSFTVSLSFPEEALLSVPPQDDMKAQLRKEISELEEEVRAKKLFSQANETKEIHAEENAQNEQDSEVDPQKYEEYDASC